ncbi:hypothetical protein AKJ09_01159 [Labilithrix luteola]|uniref:Phospholipase/carboxylesterase/thioesterase domain-containing protein n=2 Tax=Labilithrix luteola TaxID=1391654 RepID=A0A0K1PLU3_9BACT|nr:hypothetical protein AKJ09_01159 [Labilithrix luteola]
MLPTAEAAPKRFGRVSTSTNGASKPSGPFPWCAPEFDALTSDICHVGAGNERDGRRTLVIFLHGAIAKNTDWQFNQERALARQAKQSGFEAIFPRSPLRESGYLWPGSKSEDVEEKLIDSWMAAKKQLEARNGRPFDDVFVMGFSSGAYFTSSLAIRDRAKVDGYAVFAGGTPFGAIAQPARRPPVFVGVCATDSQTASHSRAFAGALAAHGFPYRADEQQVGHMFSDIHVAHAVAYLRSASTKTRAKDAK